MEDVQNQPSKTTASKTDLGSGFGSDSSSGPNLSSGSVLGSDSESSPAPKGSPNPTGANEAGGIVDKHRNQGPHVVKYTNDTQDNQGTKNLQEDSFEEIGKTLEGLKDSPLDEK